MAEPITTNGGGCYATNRFDGGLCGCTISDDWCARLGDSHNKPLFEVQCGDLSFIVTSPDFAAAGQDLGSSHVLVAPHGSVPEAQTMECTVTEVGSGESETLPMLIKPATH